MAFWGTSAFPSDAQQCDIATSSAHAWGAMTRAIAEGYPSVVGPTVYRCFLLITSPLNRNSTDSAVISFKNRCSSIASPS